VNQNEIINFCRRSINFGFYSLAFFAGISISAAQIALSIILLSWLVLTIMEKRIIFAKTSLNYPFLAYISIVIIAALAGADFIHSAKAIHKFWIALAFFAMITFIEDMKMVERIIYILIITTSIVSIYGVLQHIFPGLDIARPEGRKVVQWTAEGGIASTGFFNHHMTYGGFLLLIFSLSFSLSLSRVQQVVKSKQFFLLHTTLPTILIFAGLISSMTRNAWLGAIFSVIFIVILKVKRKIIAFSVIGSILLFLTAYCLLPTAYSLQSPLLNRLKSIFNVSANIERLYIWKSTMDMIAEHPFGVGMDNYSKAIKDYRGKYNHRFSDGSDAHAHNTILTQAAEHGILGLFAFLWIWIVFFKEGFKIYRDLNKIQDPKSKIQNFIVLGGLGAIAGFHLAGMFENNFGDAEVATMMWFIMGLVFLMKKINPTL
jgi:O-antigen ligase